MTEKPTSTKQVRRRRLRGVVVKAVMDKTITVRIDRLFSHKRLKRVIRRSRKYLVHDPKGMAHDGDTVVIEEARPFSKLKKWQVVEIIKAAGREESIDIEQGDVTTQNEEGGTAGENIKEGAII